MIDTVGLTNNSIIFAANMADVEKNVIVNNVAESESSDGVTKKTFLSKLYDHGVEYHGGAPIPVEAQTDTRYLNVFTVYSTSMCSLLP